MSARLSLPRLKRVRAALVIIASLIAGSLIGLSAAHSETIRQRTCEVNRFRRLTPPIPIHSRTCGADRHSDPTPNDIPSRNRRQCRRVHLGIRVADCLAADGALELRFASRDIGLGHRNFPLGSGRRVRRLRPERSLVAQPSRSANDRNRTHRPRWYPAIGECRPRTEVRPSMQDALKSLADGRCP